MPHATLEDRNFAVACYLTSLALGETIKWQHIVHSTIVGYFKAYEKLLQNRTTISPDGTLTALPYRYKKDYIGVILTALEKYEGVKDCCNMITDTMMTFLHEHIQKEKDNSLPKALYDWIVLGRYTGHRCAEWCQTTKTTFRRLEDWPDQPAQAFLVTDFVFLNKSGRRLSHRQVLNGTHVHYVKITWRYQKNGDHGQEITYARDYANPAFCPVLAAVRIIRRANSLRVPANHPVAVYQHRNKKCYFITDGDVADILRLAASAAHNIPAGDKTLNKWSSHSIRVTACNLLHRQMFSDSYIKNRLRWKSECFCDYLRNTFYSANQHIIPLSSNNLPHIAGVDNQRQAEAHEAIMTQS